MGERWVSESGLVGGEGNNRNGRRQREHESALNATEDGGDERDKVILEIGMRIEGGMGMGDMSFRFCILSEGSKED